MDEAALRLIAPNQPLLIAVSGGVDSMVLLDLLQRRAKQFGWRLRVAHLNHQLRGKSSDADERLVKNTANGFGLPVSSERISVAELARRKKLSIEMAAREARHDFLARIARNHGIGTICLAHQADDQVELFFLRLLRGSSPEGLVGMDEIGPSPADAKLRLVRPLLKYTKNQILEYARVEKIKFREDRTNQSIDFLRNRIRHELIPLLEKNYQPAIRKIIDRFMDLLREESRLIEAVLHETAEKKPRTKGGLRNLKGGEFGLAMERRKIHRELLGLHIQPSFQLVERLRLKGKSAFPEAGPTKREVARDIDGSLLVRDCLTTAFDGEQELICLEEEGEVTFEGVQLRWEITGLPKQLSNRLKPAVGCELFDANKVGHSIVMRHWRPGDRFQPIGMTNPVKLQDLFVNQKIPRANRHKLLIAATPAGEIVWVEGLRISERFKLDKGSLRRLKWTWCRL